MSLIDKQTRISLLLLLAATPTPPCSAVSVGSASSLFTASAGISTYTCKTYSWTAPASGSATLAFQLRNDASYSSIDDVTVYNRGVQMLANGDFESGFASPGWTLSSPNGACGTPGAVSNITSRTGTYSFKDGSTGCADQIAQSIPVIGGQIYIVSFWIQLLGSGSGITASVTLS